MSWFKDRQKAEDEFLLRNNDEVRENSKWWSRVLQDLNLMFNPYHDWFAYGTEDFEGTFDDLTNKYLEKGLTGREKEANEFSAGEAQKSRDWEEYMARNKYLFETEGMQNAGINPAMVYGGGNLVPTASNGAHASSVSPTGGLTDLIPQVMSLIRMPMEMKALQAEINKTNTDTEKTKAETEGIVLQNQITEGTKNAIIKVTNMEPEEKRATIDNILQNTKSEKVKTEVLGVQLLQDKLDYKQNQRMYDLMFEMQRMQNSYQEFVNKHQERQWNVEYRKVCAEISDLYASARKKMSDIEVNNAQKALMSAQEGVAQAQQGLIGAQTRTENVRASHEAVSTWKDYNDPKAHLVRSVVDPMDKLHNVLKIGRNFRKDFKNSDWQPKGSRVTKRSDNANRELAESLQGLYSTFGQAYEEFGDIQ